MGFSKQDEALIGQAGGGIPEPVEPTEDPTLFETIAASFRIENPVASFFAYERVEAGRQDPSFDAFAMSEGTILEQFPEMLVDVDSEDDLEKVRRNLEQELADRETIEASGGVGIASIFAAGFLDPVILLPFGGAVRSARLLAGSRFLKGGILTARAGFGGSIISEAALQNTQETRTLGESAINISAATFLSGVLGGTLASLRRPQIAEMLDQIRLDDRGPEIQPGTIGGGSINPGEGLPKMSPRRGFSEPKTKATPLELDPDQASQLKKIIGIRAFRRLTPLLRLVTSPFPQARRLSQRIINSPFITKENVAGVAGPIPIESKILQHVPRVAGSKDFITDAYVRYRQQLAGKEITGGGRAAEARFALGDAAAFGRVAGEKKPLTFKEFRREVTFASRQKDFHPIAEVKESADFIRRELFDPGFKLMQEHGLLPEDLDIADVKFAQSYLTRIYDKEKVIKDIDELDRSFRNILEVHFRHFPERALDEKGVPVRADLSDAEIKDLTQVAINNIVDQGNGRMPYETVQSRISERAARSLAVRDEAIESFLKNDIFEIIDSYGRTVFPDVEIVKEFGPAEKGNFLAGFEKELQKLREELTVMQKKVGPEQRLKLEKEFDRTILDLNSMVALLRGKFPAGRFPADSAQYRVGRALRQLNTLRFGGGFMVSSFPDVFRPAMVMGFNRVIGDGITKLAGNVEAIKLTKAENRLAGVAYELTMDTRAKSLTDLGDNFEPGTKFERGLDALTHNFFMLNGLSMWNQMFKHWSGIMVQARMLDVIQLERVGRIAENDRTWLRKNGISKETSRRMAELFQEFGDTIQGVKIANTNSWAGDLAPETIQAFRTALQREVDTIIVTPGIADRPLLMSTELGRTMGQFKSFALSATQRVLLAGLQQKDQAFFLGALGSVFMGSMVYMFKELGKGRSISTDPRVILSEGVDRSGVTGILADVNGIAEKLNLGVSRLTGGPQFSRFAGRNLLSAIAGPTAGTIVSAGGILASISSGQVTQRDVRNMRRLLPYQQLFYFQNGINAIEAQINKSLGISKSRSKRRNPTRAN